MVLELCKSPFTLLLSYLLFIYENQEEPQAHRVLFVLPTSAISLYIAIQLCSRKSM